MRIRVAFLVNLWVLSVHSADQIGGASLNGKITDAFGSPIPDAVVELIRQTDSGSEGQTKADQDGQYHLGALRAGEYSVIVRATGFSKVTLDSVVITNDEQKELPTLEVNLGRCPDSPPVREHLRLLHSASRLGLLTGNVEIEPESRQQKPVFLSGVNLRLICTNGRVCGKTRTDNKGRFAFELLSPGDYSIRSEQVGFYSSAEFGYRVYAGLQSDYSIMLEPCHRKNCNPLLLRPKIAVCE